MSIVYGVDVSKKFTANMVRDAIVECFYQAHCGSTEIFEDEKMERDYCTRIVKKAFDETGGNYENSSKEDILKVMDYLADFSGSFRNKEIIKQHRDEIRQLVEKL